MLIIVANKWNKRSMELHNVNYYSRQYQYQDRNIVAQEKYIILHVFKIVCFRDRK